MIKKISFVVLLLLLLNCVYAESSFIVDDFSFQQLTDDILNGKWNWDIGSIVEDLISTLFSSLRGNLMLVAAVFTVGVFSSLLLNLRTAFTSQAADIGFYGAYLISAVMGAKGVGIVLEYSVEIVRQLDLYIKTILPVVMSVSLASGAIVSGTMIKPLVIGISQLISFIVMQWLVPLLSVVCGMSVVDNITAGNDLSGIIAFIHKGVRWICGILMTFFVGVMTVRSMITPALDSVAGKVTRYAIANFVPAVGGLISESVSIVAGYSSALKGAVGGAGIIAAAVVCAKPLAEIASIAILYNLSSAALRPVCDKRIVGLMAGFGQIASTLLILVIIMMLMFVVNICIAVNIYGLGSVQ